MAWYPDLSSCTYFGVEVAEPLKAIGWLEKSQSFPVGRIEPPVFDRLVALSHDPWQRWSFRGWHTCDLCRRDAKTGISNLFIPGHGVIYVAPEMVTHYIKAHGYLPPQEFCDAVLACPEMKSVEYMETLVANGRGVIGAEG